jgi:hypothetical protein
MHRVTRGGLNASDCHSRLGPNSLPLHETLKDSEAATDYP